MKNAELTVIPSTTILTTFRRFLRKFVEEADRFVATETDNNTSVYESLISVIDYAFSNKSVIQHIYNSANRTTFDVYLNRICTHAIKSYFDKLEITKILPKMTLTQ